MEQADVLLKEYTDPECGGFEIKSFIDELPDDFRCPICLFAMRKPVQTTSCGHQFCHSCLLRSSLSVFDNSDEEGSDDEDNGRFKCPEDRVPIPETGGWYRDLSLERKILSLRVLCNNSENGSCDWKGELRLYQDHFFQCQNRIISCEYCSKEMRFWLRESHGLECTKFPEDCPLGCGVEKMCREEVESHMREDCLIATVPCVYEKAGCSFLDKRSKLVDHLNSSVEDHLKITWSKLQGALEELEEAQEGIMELKMENLSMKRRLNDVEEAAAMAISKTRSMENQLLQLSTVPNKIEELEVEHVSLNVTLRQSECLNKENTQRLENEIASAKSRLKDLQAVEMQLEDVASENRSTKERLNQLKTASTRIEEMQWEMNSLRKSVEPLNQLKRKVEELEIEKVYMEDQITHYKDHMERAERSSKRAEDDLHQLRTEMVIGRNKRDEELKAIVAGLTEKLEEGQPLRKNMTPWRSQSYEDYWSSRLNSVPSKPSVSTSGPPVSYSVLSLSTSSPSVSALKRRLAPTGGTPHSSKMRKELLRFSDNREEQKVTPTEECSPRLIGERMNDTILLSDSDESC